MVKSSDTTDERGLFYNPRHALIAEVAGALCLVMAVFASHAWRRHVWEERRNQIPKATVHEVLCWLDTKPNPVFKKNVWRRLSQDHSSGGHRAASDRHRNGGEIETTLHTLDINHAPPAEWERLPGWGKVLSNRTVKFREAVGGFVSIEQLKLVYGLDPDVVEANRTHLRLQEGGQTRMCLDTLSYRTLVRHPLFNAEQTKRVLRARGRALSSMEVLWERLSPGSEERAAWEPYLERCHGE